MTSIELLPIFTADLGRHEEREDAGTANDIAQACRQEEAEEIIVQIRTTHEDVIGGFTRADDDMGKVADGDEIGKGQDCKESEAPRHRHDPDNSGDEHTCRDAAHDVVHRVRRHDVMRNGQETLRNFRRRKDRAGHEKRRNGCTDDIGAEDDAPQAQEFPKIFPARYAEDRNDRRNRIFRKKLQSPEDDDQEPRRIAEARNRPRPGSLADIDMDDRAEIKRKRNHQACRQG